MHPVITCIHHIPVWYASTIRPVDVEDETTIISSLLWTALPGLCPHCLLPSASTVRCSRCSQRLNDIITQCGCPFPAQ
ncbi:unnamed protein product [Ectocarpus sp. CCAP 1310/34]|nr:unnamed protein product [Ectocarpus sp. CCAP 1310/34]